MARKISYLFFILLFIFYNGGSAIQHKRNGLQVTLTNYNIPLIKLIDSLKVDKKKSKIVVAKTKYILSITYLSKIIKSYPVVLGTNPVDDKLREGDRCTPEGLFKVRDKYPHKSWSKFIWFDYPNEHSRTKFNQAKQNKRIPANATIGGDVGIHGVPRNSDYLIDEKQNWTWGCVSLKTTDINELYDFATIGMVVEIIK